MNKLECAQVSFKFRFEWNIFHQTELLSTEITRKQCSARGAVGTGALEEFPGAFYLYVNWPIPSCFSSSYQDFVRTEKRGVLEVRRGVENSVSWVSRVWKRGIPDTSQWTGIVMEILPAEAMLRKIIFLDYWF